jgi:hypothetical protein
MAHPNKTGESNTKMKQSLSQAQSAVEIFCGSATALPGVGRWIRVFRAGDALESWAKLGFGAVPNKPATDRHCDHAKLLRPPPPLSSTR